MNEKPKFIPGPCLEKNCSWCCNPVKVDQREAIKTAAALDKNGKKIFSRADQDLIPEEEIDTTRLAALKCSHFDAASGKCLDYENRPEICEQTSCINPDSDKPLDEQHKKTVGTKFINVDRE